MFVELFLDEEKEAMADANLTFRGLCIVIYSYNDSQLDALFLRFI
jgi:hypothetical protein